MAIPRQATAATKHLTDWLVEAKVKAGDRLPSERTLAKTLGVSLYALNRAMTLCIAEGRVERHGYKNFLTGTPGAALRPTCHLVVSRRSEYLSTYRRIARELQIDLAVHTWEATEEVTAILQALDGDGVAGVICDPPSAPGQESWLPAALRLVARGIPVVSNSSWAGNKLSSITGSITHGIEMGVEHLTGLGHRELALVAAAESASEACWQRACAGARLGASAKRINNDCLWLMNRAEVDALVDLLLGEWKEVTGVVVRICHWTQLQRLLTELARKGRRVPEQLSVFAVGNAAGLQTAQPRVTSASIDMALWIEMTFDLLQREMRMGDRLGVRTPPAIMQVMPRLNPRDSTAMPGGGFSIASRLPAGLVGGAKPSVIGPGGLGSIVRHPYSLAAKASLSEKPRFSPVDLRVFANRPLRFRRGWLGDLPLLCLSPGAREIHGVPFEILGGAKHSDMGAVVFRSATNATGNARKLPDRVCIPIGARVEAVYILHGCGYAKPLQSFARYTFHGAKGALGTVPLVSLGQARGGEAKESANIQDWWSDYAHVDFPHARMVPLAEQDGGRQVTRHVFLYTLEWINPTPGRVVTHLEIVTDTEVPTTLGVLAITVVKLRNA